MKFEPVWSVWPCDACEVVERDPDAKPTPSGTVYSIKNPVSCPYTHVKIGRKIYARSKHHMEDEDFFTHDKFGVTYEDHFTPYSEIRCHDCGVPYGYIHHIGCDCEMCPKCGNQLISCDCGVKGDHKEAAFLIAVPQLTKDELKELK